MSAYNEPVCKLQKSKHTVEDCAVVALFAPVGGAATAPTRAKERTALHTVPDTLHYHRYECCCTCSVLQDLEDSVLAVLVFFSKNIGHLDCAGINLSKVVVDPIVAKLLHDTFRDDTCKCRM